MTRSTSSSLRRLICLVLVGLLGGIAQNASGQSVVDIYKKQLFRKQALRWIQESGERIVPRAPDRVPNVADGVLVGQDRPELAALGPLVPSVVISRFQRIPKLASHYFRRRFESEKWVFLGTGRVSPLDTMMTREIRARLEAEFGPPTRTVVDDDANARAANGDVFQFEYWFILEDEIPFVITDVNGPFERGVATSTIERFGSRLLEIRDTFLRPIVDSAAAAPYVDYYYDDENGQWYRTGYDGREFFLEPIRSPGNSRPVLRRGVAPRAGSARNVPHHDP